MAVTKFSYRTYLWKSFKWVVGNAVFGLAPIIFMWAVFGASDGNIGNDEIRHIIHDGAILFVCCAIMGSVLVDHFLSSFRFEKLGSIEFLTIYFTPFFILLWLCLKYFLVYDKKINDSCFDISSKTSIVTISFSFLYCVFIKANFYVKEDNKNE